MQKAIDAERSCGGDVFNPRCPSRAVLEMLGEKWALLVVHTLANGPARTSQLRRQVGGISEKDANPDPAAAARRETDSED